MTKQQAITEAKKRGFGYIRETKNTEYSSKSYFFPCRIKISTEWSKDDDGTEAWSRFAGIVL